MVYLLSQDPHQSSPSYPHTLYPHLFFDLQPLDGDGDDAAGGRKNKNGVSRRIFELGRARLSNNNNNNNNNNNDDDGDSGDDDDLEMDTNIRNGDNDDTRMAVDGDDNDEAGKKQDGAKNLSGNADKKRDVVFRGIDMTHVPIPITSNLTLCHRDNMNRTVLHYLLPFNNNNNNNNINNNKCGHVGAKSIYDLLSRVPVFDNHFLLLHLVSLGARIVDRDDNGDRISDLAVVYGCRKLYQTCIYLSGGRDGQDGVDDYYDKRKQYLAGNTNINNNVGLDDDDTVRVDPDSDARLFIEDYEKKMLKRKIIHQRQKDMYVLFNRWGRVGDRGQYQQTPFPLRADAEKEFKKVFRAKTGNDWSEYNKFEHKPKKYRLVSLESRRAPLRKENIPIDLHCNKTDVSGMKNRMNQMGLNKSNVVLGRLSRSDLEKAKNILKELLALIDRRDSTTERMNVESEEYRKISEKIAELSNNYYYILPKQGFEYEKLPILDNANKINTELGYIEELAELELASRFMVASMSRSLEINTFDYIYKCMGCRIDPIDEESMEGQYLLKYIYSTFTGKVEAIFRLQSQLDVGKFQSERSENRKLLFHGSSSTNLISILTRGLLIAHNFATKSGSMFGEGIYTADMFTKSADYCYNYASHASNVKFMLICEVDLGKVKVIHSTYSNKYPPVSHDSVLGIGETAPNPVYDVTMSSGAVMPVGDLINIKEKWKNPDGDFSFHNIVNRNEYIVYDANRVALKYLIQFVQ
ncbi:hypothetical protein HELRODRAFT_190616 [Helobdella robusta]|uniref:Poly [ADP-ribose] polymerase n=1 Tax=Helobdella robusta TaxID=6412 RepID=T1FS51_HELRO|nr:hypothetical protein HELRODRAFT_190616 [Helobdella robusta]ESO08808.1 hypothetical protein HELRODRAFT_190616 [Helobdella robusta]